MIYSIDPFKKIETIPHKKDYDMIVRRLTHDELTAIEDELNNEISGDRIHTSSWIPGSDWTDTVYAPLYRIAGHDEKIAGMYFGLLLWVVVMNHLESWSFGRYELDGIPIEGITYFSIQP